LPRPIIELVPQQYCSLYAANNDVVTCCLAALEAAIKEQRARTKADNGGESDGYQMETECDLIKQRRRKAGSGDGDDGEVRLFCPPHPDS
jgi:hypothetical protein